MLHLFSNATSSSAEWAGFLKTAGTDPSGLRTEFPHDALGRFSAVTAAVQSVSTVFDYACVQGSDLLAGWVSNAGTSFTRAFEDTRDLIASVENVSDSTLVSRLEYTNDAVGRRVERRDSGAAFASTWTNAFAYNVRAEIAEATMRNGESSYEFDPIRLCEGYGGQVRLRQVYGGQVGNRTKVTLPEEPQPFTYQSNELHQYLALHSLGDGGPSITNRIAASPIHDDDGNMLSGPAGTEPCGRHAQLATEGTAWQYGFSASLHLLMGDVK